MLFLLQCLLRITHHTFFIIWFGLYTLTIHGWWFTNSKPFTASNKRLNVTTLVQTPKIDTKKCSIDELITLTVERETQKEAIVELNDESDLIVTQGVHLPPCDKVYLISRGYMRSSTPGSNDNYIENGGGLKTAYDLIKDHIVGDAACITFDYPDNRQNYSFGQKIDMQCISHVYRQIIKQNPNVTIIFIGDCRGAKCVLEFLTKKPSNIGAVILFSPFTNVWDLTQQIAKNYVSWLPKSDVIIYYFFNYYFPSYSPQKETLCSRLHLIDPSIPFCIAHRIHDTVISSQSVKQLVNSLKQQGNPLRVIISDDRTFKHSRMSGIKKVQEETELFLMEYGLK